MPYPNASTATSPTRRITAASMPRRLLGGPLCLELVVPGADVHDRTLTVEAVTRHHGHHGAPAVRVLAVHARGVLALDVVALLHFRKPPQAQPPVRQEVQALAL